VAEYGWRHHFHSGGRSVDHLGFLSDHSGAGAVRSATDV
jgi:hypothetical protein